MAEGTLVVRREPASRAEGGRIAVGHERAENRKRGGIGASTCKLLHENLQFSEFPKSSTLVRDRTERIAIVGVRGEQSDSPVQAPLFGVGQQGRSEPLSAPIEDDEPGFDVPARVLRMNIPIDCDLDKTDRPTLAISSQKASLMGVRQGACRVFGERIRTFIRPKQSA